MITYAIAKEYLDNGWSVIPVNLYLDNNGKAQKKPIVAWREYQERLPTEAELHQWFDNGSVNAIGLVTGKISRVVVVDVDMAEVLFISPIMVKTISGGTHAYFRWTEEIRNDAGIDDRPIDFRGDGGFVVLPPSQLGDQKYSWISKTETMFLDPVPDELKKLLKIRKSSKEVKVEGVTAQGLPIANEGERNKTAAQVAGMLCSGISKKLLPHIGLQIFESWNKTNCKPPLPDSEIQRTWQSIYNTEIRNHPQEEKEESYSIYTGEKVIQEYNALLTNYGVGLTTGFTALDAYFNFVPEQLYLLSAPTHQGKTTFALNLAARIATYGDDVLFCSLEQGIFIAPRVTSIIDGPFPDSLSILTSTKMLTIEDLTKAILAIPKKPRLIFVDHLHFIQKEGRGATEDIDAMILKLQNMAKVLHLPIFVIAHVRKLNADRAPELDDLRDSSSLSQVPSVVMLLYRRKNHDIKSMQENQSYLKSNGVLLIAKNRLQGKTGVVSFVLKNTGEFVFTS